MHSTYDRNHNGDVWVWPKCDGHHVAEIIERFAINYSDVGNLTAVHQGAYFLGSLAAGRIAVKARPELIIPSSTLIGGGLILLLGHINHYSMFIAIYGILGALIAFAWVAMVRYAAISMEKPHRIAALSTAACGTALGFLINGFVIPPAIRYFGFSKLWLTLGLSTVVIGILSFIVLTAFAWSAAQRNRNGINLVSSQKPTGLNFRYLRFA